MRPVEDPDVQFVAKPGSYRWPPSPTAEPAVPVVGGKLASLLAGLLACFVLATSAFAQESTLPPAAADFREEILPILEAHCHDCHGPAEDDPAGELSLTRFDRREAVTREPQTWKRVLDAVEAEEMPPEDAGELPPERRRLLLSWIRAALREPSAGGRAASAKPALRRLTRLEYNNTLRDLLGLETDVLMFPERLPFDKSYFDPAADRMPSRLRIGAREYGAKYPVLLPDAGLPGDTRAEHGFTNRGDAQTLSPGRLDQYVRLAEQIAFHPELLSRAARMQEIFPEAEFQPMVVAESARAKPERVGELSQRLAPNDNVTRTADGSAFDLATFRERIARAYREDRGGVYGVAEGNTTVAGKGGVLHLAFGENASRTITLNPSEDIWNVAFATAEESSGDLLMTNKTKGVKEFFFGFQRKGDRASKGVAEVGIVLLSRRGQSGTINVTADFDNDESRTVSATLDEGAGNDNVFVSLAAPEGSAIKRLRIDGRDFSGPYVLLDDLAVVTLDRPTSPGDLVGIEKPQHDGGELPSGERERNAAAAKREAMIDRTIARLQPQERLRHFMHRAFRRGVSNEELELYFGLYERARAGGADDEKAMRGAIHGVLASPSFLYLIERGVAEAEAANSIPLSDHELASRLSFFLWSSMPDDELRQLADRGELRDPGVLDEQVRRMLADPRVRELSENFFVEWLRLRELWSAQPDPRQFRDFYDGPKGKRTLARDMFCEPLLLFETLLIEDRSLLELIDADFTFVNDRLAELYGIEAASGDDRDWVRVTLTDQQGAAGARGGILTTGAVLTLTSFPHRTSPIRRGAWFLETVFNRPPPPPAVAVADIDEQEDAEGLSLREKVQRHRADAACAVCHNRIDPPGFALENFDAIGRWRERDGQRAIDASGTLRGLGSFEGPAQFKLRIAEQRERFARGFVEHLLSYALARPLDYRDVSTVDRILEATSDGHHPLRQIILEIVRSHPFQNLPGEETP